jgi:putative metalloprotease
MMKRLLAFAAGALMLVSCSETFNATRALQGGLIAAQALSITDEQVQAYVHQYITQLDAQSKVLPENNAYTKRLRNLTKGLDSVDGVPLNFKVYQEDQVNAFACADGSVRVYTGIMDIMSDNELLGVIGHEIGHVALKHTKKEMRTSLLTSAALEGLASTSEKVAVLTDSQLGAIGNAVLNAQYSKKQESQADDYGYEFLKAAGKNPWGMAMSFEKLKSVAGGSGAQASAVQKLFSSHPDTDTRIQRMAARATSEGYKRPAK